MNKKTNNFFVILASLLFFIKFSFASDITIKASVNNEIITNFDIEKEANYLIILNPNLNQLEKSKVLSLAQNSLINEIVKKIEVKKFFDEESQNPYEEEYLKDLYSKLNVKDNEDLEIKLQQSNNYTVDQIKEKVRIELFWNEIVYARFNKQINIDKEKLIKKIDKLKNLKQKEYLLSEIIFAKKNNVSLEDLKNEIMLSINEIGFNNTANIYSIADSSKFGGKLGWINKNSLSKKIAEKLELINENEFTDIIKIGNNYLILKIEEIKMSSLSINKKKELEKMIKIETNRQLNQFSRILFNKLKVNHSINEK